MSNFTDHSVNIARQFGVAWQGGEDYLAGMIIIHQGMMYKALDDNVDEEPHFESDVWFPIYAQSHFSVQNAETKPAVFVNIGGVRELIPGIFETVTQASPFFEVKDDQTIGILRDIPMCHISAWVHLEGFSQRLQWAGQFLKGGQQGNWSRLQLNSYNRGYNSNVVIASRRSGQLINFRGRLLAGEELTIRLVLEGATTAIATDFTAFRCFLDAAAMH